MNRYILENMEKKSLYVFIEKCPKNGTIERMLIT